MIPILLIFGVPTIAVLVGREIRYAKTAIKTANAPTPPSEPVWIGDLIVYLDGREGPVRAKAMETITQMLPELTSDDATRLTAEQRRTLYAHLFDDARPSKDYHLYIKRHSDYVLAVLEVIARHNWQDALPHVRRFIEKTSDDHLDRNARACLSQLVAQQERLLQSEGLLRPANAGTPTDATELLRPNTAEVEARRRAIAELDGTDEFISPAVAFPHSDFAPKSNLAPTSDTTLQLDREQIPDAAPSDATHNFGPAPDASDSKAG